MGCSIARTPDTRRTWVTCGSLREPAPRLVLSRLLLGSLSTTTTHVGLAPTVREKGSAVKTRIFVVLALIVTLALAMAAYGCSSAQEPGTPDKSTSESSAASDTGAGAMPSGYVTVDVNTAYQELSIMNKETQIVDVREPDEWAATGVPVGAVLISLGELEARATDELAKDVPTYVICNSGNRSRTGSEILVGLGYTEVYNVDGGIQTWLAAGLPVEYRR